MKETNDASFKSDVLQALGPVLVDFWAPWCGPCKLIKPILEKLSEELGDKIKVFSVNVDENEKLAVEYHITAVPTVLIFKNGMVDKKIVGVQTADFYRKEL